MIFYFSGTGNSEYVAKRLAEGLGEPCGSIAECMRNEWFEFALRDNETVGFVVPVYYFGLPSIVEEFLEKFKIYPACATCVPYVHFTATYGAVSGRADWYFREALAKRQSAPSALFGVKMVDNWTPMYDVSDQEKNRQTLAEAELQIDRIIQAVKERRAVDMLEDKSTLEKAQGYYAMYDEVRATSHFSVEDSCIGCGLCADECPVGAIQMKDGKPAWVKDACVMCVRCLHKCPSFAIHYDVDEEGNAATKQHGQYFNPFV